jgi:hypothetical protein
MKILAGFEKQEKVSKITGAERTRKQVAGNESEKEAKIQFLNNFIDHSKKFEVFS